MPLDRQVVSVPFVKGLNTQPDPKQLEVGELLAADNVVFESPRQLKTRPPYFVPGTLVTTRPTSSVGIFAYKNGAITLSRATAHAFGAEWRPLGAFDSATVASVVPVPSQGSTTVDGVDACYVYSVTAPYLAVVQWVYGGRLVIAIIDVATGQPLMVETLNTAVANRSQVNCIAVYVGNGQNSPRVVYSTTTGDTIYYTCSPVDLTVTTTTDATKVHAVFKDPVVVSGSGVAALVSGGTAGSIKVSSTAATWYTFTSSSYVANAPVSISRNETSGKYHVIHQTGASTSDLVLTVSGTTWSQSVATTSIIAASRTGGSCGLSTAVAAMWGDASGNWFRSSVSDTPTATLAGAFPRGTVPVSPPWADANDRVYAVIFNQAPWPVADFSLSYDSQLWAVL